MPLVRYFTGNEDQKAAGKFSEVLNNFDGKDLPIYFLISVGGSRFPNVYFRSVTPEIGRVQLAIQFLNDPLFYAGCVLQFPENAIAMK